MNNKEWDASKIQSETNTLRSEFKEYTTNTKVSGGVFGGSSTYDEDFDRIKKDKKKVNDFLFYKYYLKSARRDDKMTIIIEFMSATGDPFYVHLAKIFEFLGLRETFERQASMEISREMIERAPNEYWSNRSDINRTIYAATAKSISKIEKRNRKVISKLDKEQQKKLRKINGIYTAYRNCFYLYYDIINFVKGIYLSPWDSLPETINLEEVREAALKDPLEAIELLNKSGYFNALSHTQVSKFKR